jgi:putative glutamine amidotransferase
MRMIKREIPVIGISTEIDIPGRISVKRKYVDAVLQAGGIPFILPFTDNVQILQSVVSFIDGLLLTGGGDISPVIYGESTLPELCFAALSIRKANSRFRYLSGNADY